MPLLFCTPAQRITNLDVLQGLVLLGLLIAQAYGQLASPQLGHLLPLDEHHPDLPVHFMVQLLVSGQFERIGSFLFGLRFYQCWQQANQAGSGLTGLDALRLARRLLLLLLGIGLIISLLFRSTDLLFQYTLLGLTLLYFRNQSVASLLNWTVCLVGLAILVPSILSLLPAAIVSTQSGIESATHFPKTSFRPGLLGEFLSWQSPREWLLPGRSVSQGFSPFISYELMMLGGLLAGKLKIGLLSRDIRIRMNLSLLQVLLLPVAFFVKGAWVALALGLVALPHGVVKYQPMLLALSGFLGPSLLTGVYLLDMGLNTRLTPGRRVNWLGPVGQMYLTNYVLQSILCPLLMYVYGVAVSGPIPVWGKAGIVMGIYAILIGFSRVWSKHSRQGPLEWVCRQWLYGKSG